MWGLICVFIFLQQRSRGGADAQALPGRRGCAHHDPRARSVQAHGPSRLHVRMHDLNILTDNMEIGSFCRFSVMQFFQTKINSKLHGSQNPSPFCHLPSNWPVWAQTCQQGGRNPSTTLEHLGHFTPQSTLPPHRLSPFIGRFGGPQQPWDRPNREHVCAVMYRPKENEAGD